MKKLFLTALLLGTAATPAFAQEEASFSGLRIEALVGYDTLRSGNRDDDDVDTGEDEGHESLDGIVYGGAIGFDFDLGGAVAGVEAELSESTGDQDIDESIDAPFSSRIATGMDLYLGGRLGFRVAPSTLVYAKGGWTKTSIDGRFEEDDELLEFDTSVEGWRLGAGLEQMVGRNAYAKIEYRYSKYGDLELDEDDLDGEDAETDIDLDRHQVMIGFGFRF